MILYQVRYGIITVHSVKRRTRTGWAAHNGGRIRNEVTNHAIDLVVSYFTEDYKEAIKKAKSSREQMAFMLQISQASSSDVESFVEHGEQEASLPSSRMYPKSQMLHPEAIR